MKGAVEPFRGTSGLLRGAVEPLRGADCPLLGWPARSSEQLLRSSERLVRSAERKPQKSTSDWQNKPDAPTAAVLLAHSCKELLREKKGVAIQPRPKKKTKAGSALFDSIVKEHGRHPR